MSLLNKLETTCEDMELMIIINEEELKIIDSMQITGDMANTIAQQRSKLQSSLQLNKLLIANLYKKIEELKTKNSKKDGK